MSKTKDFIVEQLKSKLSGFEQTAKDQVVGKVLKVADGIALVSGLSTAMMSEILEFECASGVVRGVALNLEENQVGVIILGSADHYTRFDDAKAVSQWVFDNFIWNND